MPWNETCLMDERMKFIAAYLGEESSFSHLCRCFGISRTTGYKWVARYESSGPEGLLDRSRAAQRHPNAVPEAIERQIVDFRRQHPHWGPRKLLDRLGRRFTEVAWPCAATVASMLKRHGLSVARKPRRRCPPSSQPLGHCKSSNDVWCADFKGWFRTQDGRRCDPLTITDGATRFILRCQGLSGWTGFGAVQPLFEATFRQYGVPRAIRTDNGPPFASVGLGGLSRLSVWWLRLGIVVERIAPGKPQQNGRHERMHRTLKAEAINPPRRTIRAQQGAFDRFCLEFNLERPHEALNYETPGSLYVGSERALPQRLPEMPQYADDWDTRMVRGAGQMKWGGKDVLVGAALSGQRVGLEPIDSGLWRVYFMDTALGLFDERKGRIAPEKKNQKKASNTT